MGSVEVENLKKVFGESVLAVDGIDLEVKDGEFFSLLGPSGCGKTTTLRMISGFETPTEGKVSIGGEDMTTVPPEGRSTNMVFQDLALFTHMDVHDNIAYGLKRSGLDDDEIDDRVVESLELVNMSGYQDRNVTELSGGQQQRIALARAIANYTDMLLLDEPLASLDRKLRQQMQLELRNIHEEVGMTFFYVTHDQEAAMTMSDRMAVMNDGEIEQVGSPSEVYDEPANQFVADFIGDMNRFDGTFDGGTFVTESGDEFAVDSDAPDSRSGSLVIRPEKILITEDGGLDVPNTIQATVQDAVFRGSNTRYEVMVDGRLIDIEAPNRSRTPPYSQGDQVEIGWSPQAGMVYVD